jgi:hypothetical protein
MAAGRAASTRSAASASIPGRTRLYRSSVIPILECPSRSLATFGWTPWLSRWVAWACLKSWNRMRGREVPSLAKPILGDGVELQRRAVSLCYHECIIREANADLEKLLSLPQSMGVVRAIPPHGWPTGPVCDPCRSWASCNGRLSNCKLAAGKINILPTQGGDLATAHPAENSK